MANTTERPGSTQDNIPVASPIDSDDTPFADDAVNYARTRSAMSRRSIEAQATDAADATDAKETTQTIPIASRFEVPLGPTMRHVEHVEKHPSSIEDSRLDGNGADRVPLENRATSTIRNRQIDPQPITEPSTENTSSQRVAASDDSHIPLPEYETPTYDQPPAPGARSAFEPNGRWLSDAEVSTSTKRKQEIDVDLEKPRPEASGPTRIETPYPETKNRRRRIGSVFLLVAILLAISYCTSSDFAHDPDEPSRASTASSTATDQESASRAVDGNATQNDSADDSEDGGSRARTVSHGFLYLEDEPYTENNRPFVPSHQFLIGRRLLEEGDDYILEFERQVDGESEFETVDGLSDAGTYRATVMGTGNYTGTYTQTVMVYAANDVNIVFPTTERPLFCFASKTPYTIDFAPRSADGTLRPNEDFAVSYSGWTFESGDGTALDGISTPGIYAISITGKGEYQGHLELEVSCQDVTIAPIGKQRFTGSPVTPTVEASMADGFSLMEGFDYSVTYRDNVDPGTATVVLEGIGLFAGTVTAQFEIVND